MKRGISKFKRALLIFISTLLLASVAVLAILFVEDSTMRVRYGNETREYFIPFYSRDNVNYEDSELFEYLYRSSMEDIVRMCVIKNQMETNGAYDAKKEIDITAFANRNSIVYDSSVTAIYTLEDMIKWGNKGFDMQEIDAENMPFSVDKERVSVLVPRYKTVDGKDLLECANTYDEYQFLVGNLIETAQSLFSNYGEYENFKKSYGVGLTNMQYCIQMNNNGNIIRYTNMHNIDIKMTIDDISSDFIKQLKYVYYNPDKMTINTNFGISAPEMKNYISKYDYSFSDNSRIWFGFDDSYMANDGFKYAKDYYDSKTGNTHGIVMVVAIWIIFFAYLSIVVFLIAKEGRTYKKKKKKISKVKAEDDIEIIDGGQEKESAGDIKLEEEFDDAIVLGKLDHMPIEFMVILAFAIAVLDLVVLFSAGEYIHDNIFGGFIIYAIAVCVIIVCNYTFLITLFCFIRRIKAKNLLENSCCKWLAKTIREKTVDAYDHGHAVIRTWIPYILFLLINLVLLLLSPVGMIIAAVFDLIVGVYLYRANKERQAIVNSINTISNGDINHQLDTKNMHGDNLELGKAVNNIGDGIRKAVESSMKNEKMKADLITNVSHDIKTPLTSIISYVDLIKRENIQDEKIKGYIEVLDAKSQRLKQLTDDLVEASKISSGNIVLKFEKINLVELVNQSIGEFEDKFADHGLKCRFVSPEKPVYVNVDARSMFRVIENLYNNIYKYALQGTRVYIDMDIIGTEGAQRVQLSFKNISENQLNMSAEELLERFKQGDESRKTEGSGLGLSIAKSLTEAMNGQFDIFLDGDLFKIILTFNTI